MTESFRQGSGAGQAIRGVSPAVVLLRGELAEGRMKILRSSSFAGLDLTLARGHDAIWFLLRRPGRGGLAYRAAFLPAGIGRARMVRRRKGEAMHAEVESPIGRHRIAVSLKDGAIPMVRIDEPDARGAPARLVRPARTLSARRE